MLRPPTPPRLVLIRGLPGSGKTTLATDYLSKGYRHFEADQYFMVDGDYRFNGEQLAEAHAWCLQKVREALDDGDFVCVANVFATVDDIKPYTQLGIAYQVVEAAHVGRSIHKVSAGTLRAMKSKWVPTPELVKTLRTKRPLSPACDTSLHDLTFPMVEFGHQQVPWDLRVLLYKGGAGFNYRGAEVFQRIAAGELGLPLGERLELVKRIHEEMTAMLVMGGARETTLGIPAWHQFRRTGAVNMFASGEISDSSMQLQMKHLTRAQPLYYGRGNTALHLNNEVRVTLVNAQYEATARELVAMRTDRFVSPHGEKHKARLLAPANNGEPVNLISEADAVHYEKVYREHRIGGRLTVLGACMKNGQCDGDCVSSVGDCAGGDDKAPCNHVLFDRTRAPANQKRLEAVRLQLAQSPPDTPRYRHLLQEVRGLENYFGYINRAV